MTHISREVKQSMSQGAEVPKCPRPTSPQLLCHFFKWRPQVLGSFSSPSPTSWSPAATGRTATKEEVVGEALATTLHPLLLNPRLTMIRWASWSWWWLMRIILVVNVDDGWLWWWSCCQCVDDDGDERVGDRGKDSDISEDYVNQMLIMMWYCCLQDEGGKERKTFWQRLVGRRRQ